MLSGELTESAVEVDFKAIILTLQFTVNKAVNMITVLFLDHLSTK